MKIRPLILPLAMMSSLVLGLHAAPITQVNTFSTPGVSLTSDGTTGVLLTTGSFNMGAGSNTVVFMLSSEGPDIPSPSYSVTYGGQAMTLGVSANQGRQVAGIYYLINPLSTNAAFEITTGTSETSAFVYSYISLSNVAGVAGSDTAISTTTTQSTQLSLDYTTTTAGGFALAALANNATNTRPSPSYVSGNADQVLFGTLAGSTSSAGTDGYNANGSGMGALHVYGDVATAGSYTDIYSNPYQRSAYVTLAFVSVPEPGTFALLVGGVGMLAVLRRRRI